jgi:hypothetical protein
MQNILGIIFTSARLALPLAAQKAERRVPAPPWPTGTFSPAATSATAVGGDGDREKERGRVAAQRQIPKAP